MRQTFIILLFLTSHFYLMGQGENTFINALKAGETASIEAYLEEKIDFCIFEDQLILPRKSAVQKLETFFNNNKISNAEIIHKGSSKDKSSQYKVVKISTSKGTFRMFLFASGDIGTKTIKEIRIDKF